MSDKYTTVFCSPSSLVLGSPIITGRLGWNGFKRSIKKPNVFYKSILTSKLSCSNINVSYYYYVAGKRKQVKNNDYESIASNILIEQERKEYVNSFNLSNGYSQDYIASRYSF